MALLSNFLLRSLLLPLPLVAMVTTSLAGHIFICDQGRQGADGRAAAPVIHPSHSHTAPGLLSRDMCCPVAAALGAAGSDFLILLEKM